MLLLRRKPRTENGSARGAYVLLEAEGGPRQVILLATDFELHLVVRAREILRQQGVRVAVVSVPCVLIVNEQHPAYQCAVLSDARPRGR